MAHLSTGGRMLVKPPIYKVDVFIDFLHQSLYFLPSPHLFFDLWSLKMAHPMLLHLWTCIPMLWNKMAGQPTLIAVPSLDHPSVICVFGLCRFTKISYKILRKSEHNTNGNSWALKENNQTGPKQQTESYVSNRENKVVLKQVPLRDESSLSPKR